MDKSKSLGRKFILSILIIFILGTLSHFIYDLTGRSLIVGSVFPVNESIWEHLKLLLIPMLGWWIIFYLVNLDRFNLNKDKWFFSGIIALISAMLVQLSIFYIYTGALGIESVIIDILIFLLAVICGQYIGLHFYKYGKVLNYKISIFIMILIILFFIFITFNPPHLPIFLDSVSGNYGL